MAVQKSKKSRSKRGHRRSHNYLSLPVLFNDKDNECIGLYHHINRNGFYRGNKYIFKK